MKYRPKSLDVLRHRWCFDDVRAKDWLSASAALSRWFDIYTLLVPDNEAFYIRTLRRCAEAPLDDFEYSELMDFFRQESLHGVAHKAFWPKMSELGIEFNGFVKAVNWLLYCVLEPLQPYRIRLSVVAAIEHINASLGNIVLKRDLMASATPSLRELFYWHFAEEIEHKSVAHKALTRRYPGYLNRIIGGLIAFPTFYFLTFLGMVYLLNKERKLFRVKTAKELFEFWVKKGVLKDTLLHLGRYFSRSFDPWELDDLFLAIQVRHSAFRHDDAENPQSVQLVQSLPPKLQNS